MIIVSAEKQKKHLTRLVFADGGEILLDSSVCENHALRADTEITEEKLNELKYESEYERAKERALWYLDRADRTEKALYQKLVTAGFDKRACAEVLSRLKELGLVDDRRFAENFAGRCRDACVSPREAVSKMLAKGVPYEIAKAAADNSDTDEEEQLRRLIEKKYARKLGEENGARKVYAALIRKGFSFSAVRSVLKKYSEELEYCEE